MTNIVFAKFVKFESHLDIILYSRIFKILNYLHFQCE